MLEILLTISLLHWVVLITPGVNFVLLVQLAVSGKRATAALAVAGITTATLTWATLAVGGVSVIFAAHPAVRLIAQIAGAVRWYFETRDRNAPPSLADIVPATFWLCLCRPIGFGLGSYFLFGAHTTATSNPEKKSFDDMWLTALALAAGGLYFLYLGFFGRGYRSAELRDDIRLHAENKKRYPRWF